MPQPAATQVAPRSRSQLRLEDVLGDVPKSYPVGFCVRPDAAATELEATEREAIDEEILAELVRF